MKNILLRMAAFFLLLFFSSSVQAHGRSCPSACGSQNSRALSKVHDQHCHCHHGSSRILTLIKEYEALRTLHPSVATLLNLWPLGGLGIGSFVQGDFTGGLMSIGGVVGGAMLFLYSITAHTEGLSIIGGLTMLVGLVYSIVRPFTWDAHQRWLYIQKRRYQPGFRPFQQRRRRTPRKQPDDGFWSKKNPTRLPGKTAKTSLGTSSPIHSSVQF
jgi:hypothetical protein